MSGYDLQYIHYRVLLQLQIKLILVLNKKIDVF